MAIPCDCADCGCGGNAVAEYKRGDRLLKLCTRCDLPGDERVRLLVDEVTPEQIEFDNLGAVCLADWLKRGWS